MLQRVAFSDEKLQDLHEQGFTNVELAEMLDCAYATIDRHLKGLGLKRNVKNKLSEGKIQRIVELARNGLSIYQIANETGHDWNTVKKWLERSKLEPESRNYFEFTDKEIEFLGKHYNFDMTVEQIAEVINHSPGTIQHKANHLGLTGPRKKLDITQVRELHDKGYTVKEMASCLSISSTPVYRCLKKLDLVPHIKGYNIIKGREGEDAAVGYFADNDFEVITRGTNLTPYDFIVQGKSITYAINVRNHSKYLNVLPSDIEKLKRHGIPVILWKSKNQWYWMEVIG